MTQILIILSEFSSESAELNVAFDFIQSFSVQGCFQICVRIYGLDS